VPEARAGGAHAGALHAACGPAHVGALYIVPGHVSEPLLFAEVWGD
jgi:hypothetical protein